MESIRTKDIMFQSRDRTASIKVMTLPDRKKPVLVVERDGHHIGVANFKDEDAADEFIGALDWIFESRMVR